MSKGDTMNEYMIGLSEKSWLYEVHKPGCRHLNMKSNYLYGFCTYKGDTAAEAAADFEARNEECFTKLAPCVKRG